MFGLGDAVLVIVLAVVGVFVFLALVGFIIQFFDWLDNRKSAKSAKSEIPTIGSAEYGIELARSRMLADKAIQDKIKALQAEQKALRELKKYV